MADEQPVIINPSSASSQFKSGARNLIMAAAGLGLLSHFLTPEQMKFVQSDQFIEILSALAATGAFAWSQIDAVIHKRQIVAAANAAPNTKFVVAQPDAAK